MLFGKEEIRERILDDAQNIAAERGFKLVYGAVLGSISRGIPGYDSDYDLRFLYVKDSFPQKIYLPEKCTEKEIVYRHIPNQVLDNADTSLCPYDKIAFWELSSFIYFLVNPCIGNETHNKSHLYHVVEHTFLSPYIWDPYGIQVKVTNFLFRNYKKQYSLEAYKNILEAKYTNEGIEVISRNYLTSIWAALSICWISSFGGPAPIDFGQLLYCVKDENLRATLVSCNNSFYESSRQNFESTSATLRKAALKKVRMRRIKAVDDFIEAMYMCGIHIGNKSNGYSELQKQNEIESILWSIWSAMNPKEVIGIS